LEALFTASEFSIMTTFAWAEDRFGEGFVEAERNIELSL
jgi:hypothetical protein